MKIFTKACCSVLLISLTSACAGESTIIQDEKFEKFYSALGMDDFIAPNSAVELNVKDIFGEDSVTVYVPDTESLNESNSSIDLLGKKSETITLNIPMDHVEAKRIYREKILERLTNEEIELGTEFYSSEAGLKIHRAIIDAENAVNDFINGE